MALWENIVLLDDLWTGNSDGSFLCGSEVVEVTHLQKPLALKPAGQTNKQEKSMFCGKRNKKAHTFSLYLIYSVLYTWEQQLECLHL